MRKFMVFIVGILISSAGIVSAQSYAFGLKGGPTIGLQRWNNYQGNDPLIAYHVVSFIETAGEQDQGSIYAELGYHVKGRTVHFNSSVNPLTGATFEARNFQLKFNNISLSAGAKKKFPLGTNQAYYSLAIRGEYNLSADLEIYEGFEAGINKVLYGLTLGGGFEFPFSELLGGLIDIRFSPDLSRQIFIPPFEWDNPFTGRYEQIREQSIKNIAFEISLGLRFLHKIIYIE
ncbi:MAG: hypothetical protein KDC80_20675 [Saprospiraceae bacterium]|nr:hypothetical protein [Saprospiraceae bacterium]